MVSFFLILIFGSDVVNLIINFFNNDTNCRMLNCKNGKGLTCSIRPNTCQQEDIRESGTFACSPKLKECPDCKIHEDGTMDLPECLPNTQKKPRCPIVECDEFNVAYG